MSKHHHQSKAEQENNRSRGTATSLRQKLPLEKGEPGKGGLDQLQAAADNTSIQLRAYQIHAEKGGHALDNWLEAERILKIDHPMDYEPIGMGKAEIDI